MLPSDVSTSIPVRMMKFVLGGRNILVIYVSGHGFKGCTCYGPFCFIIVKSFIYLSEKRKETGNYALCCQALIICPSLVCRNLPLAFSHSWALTAMVSRPFLKATFLYFKLHIKAAEATTWVRARICHRSLSRSKLTHALHFSIRLAFSPLQALVSRDWVYATQLCQWW